MGYNGYIASIIFNIGIMALWCGFLWLVLDGRRFSVKLTLLFTLLISLAYILPVLFLSDAGSLIRLIVFPTGPLAMAFLLFYGKTVKKLLAVGLELAASMAFESLYTPLISSLNAASRLAVWAASAMLVRGLMFLPLLALVLLLFAIPLTKSKNNLSNKQVLIFCALPLSQAISLPAIQFHITMYGKQEFMGLLIICTALFLISDITLYRMMAQAEQRVELEVENKLLEKQLELQLAHYGSLTEQFEQIRTMRHDIYHHLNTINILLREGNTAEASEYADQLMPLHENISKLGSCQNPVVDAFLSSRIRDAEDRGISVKTDIMIPEELNISNTDLIVLFGNIMDNAVEACGCTEIKEISLRSHAAKGYLIVTESNPAVKAPQKKRRRIPELERGVGFRVLSALAKKYDGSFKHGVENGVYTVTVMLRA